MEIVILGDERLRQKSEPVKEITPELQQNIEEMFELMFAADGVGLAAPQVGINERYFVCVGDDDVKRVFINPQIIATSEEMCEYEEGCLSIPKLYEKIMRPAKITVQALNEKGKPFTIEADGFLARVIQHEYDHLDGIMYIDRGDPEFAEKAAEKCRRREERRREKEAAKAKKEAKIARINAKRISD